MHKCTHFVWRDGWATGGEALVCRLRDALRHNTSQALSTAAASEMSRYSVFGQRFCSESSGILVSGVDSPAWNGYYTNTSRSDHRAPVYERDRTHYLYRDAVTRRWVLTAYAPTAADDGNCTALPASAGCDLNTTGAGGDRRGAWQGSDDHVRALAAQQPPQGGGRTKGHKGGGM
eukprot:g3895.t1